MGIHPGTIIRRLLVPDFSYCIRSSPRSELAYRDSPDTSSCRSISSCLLQRHIRSSTFRRRFFQYVCLLSIFRSLFLSLLLRPLGSAVIVVYVIALVVTVIIALILCAVTVAVTTLRLLLH